MFSGTLLLDLGGPLLDSGPFLLNLGVFWVALNPYSLVGAIFSLSRTGANQFLKAQGWVPVGFEQAAFIQARHPTQAQEEGLGAKLEK